MVEFRKFKRCCLNISFAYRYKRYLCTKLPWNYNLMLLYKTIIRVEGFFTFICTEEIICEFIDSIKVIGYWVLYESHSSCYFIYINRIGSKSFCSLWHVVNIFSYYHMIEFLFNIERMILICGNRGSWNKNC